MKWMIPQAHTSGLLTLFLLTNALGDVPTLSTNRDLQIKTDGAITLLEPGKGAHAVRISQTFVGNSADGCDENDDSSNARIMFATFMDPDTLQEKCGIFQRNVSPCFQETVVVGCDIKKNTATINLYVVDESFDKGMTTDNPRMGRCSVGWHGSDIIKRAIKVTETFDCLPLTEEEKRTIRFNTCSDRSDYCAEGTYCDYSPGQGNICRLYAQPGDPCNRRTCDPKTSFCYSRDSCDEYVGICVAFSNDAKCSSDEDCEEVTDYCDPYFERCKPKNKKGDCCVYRDDSNSCAEGTYCGEGDVCRPYATIGDPCDVKEYSYNRRTCDPKTSFCYWGDPCDEYVGICVAFSNDVKCSSDKDCEEITDFCDNYASRCQPRPKKGDCCESTGSYCNEELICEYEYDGRTSCRTLCNVEDGGSSCSEKELCTYEQYYDDTVVPEESFCKPFVLEKGLRCDYSDLCDPETLYCFGPNSFSGGICWTLGNCKDVSDCDSDEEWCDMTEGLCAPRLPLEYYDCDPKVEKQCQEGLECKEDKYGWECRLSDEPCSGQTCGGPKGIKCDCLCENKGQTPICVDNEPVRYSSYDDDLQDDFYNDDFYDDCDPDEGDVNCLGYCTCSG